MFSGFRLTQLTLQLAVLSTAAMGRRLLSMNLHVTLEQLTWHFPEDAKFLYLNSVLPSINHEFTFL